MATFNSGLVNFRWAMSVGKQTAVHTDAASGAGIPITDLRLLCFSVEILAVQSLTPPFCFLVLLFASLRSLARVEF